MTFRDLRLRLRALVASRRVERELHEELAFHIERETQKHLAAGLTPAAAGARAAARFGSVAHVADECRDARGTGFVETTVSDIVYAFRTFRRTPLASLTIVATVALGLGLVTVVFTVYNVLFLRADAVRNPHELFAVERPIGPESTLAFTRTEYDAIRRETSVFSDVIAQLRPVRARLDGRRVNGALVTGNFFEMLGVAPMVGRALRRDDDELSAPPVIVLSDRGWKKLFAGDASAIGRRVVVNGASHEIVGVMPDGFRGLSITQPDYWAPLALLETVRETGAVGDEKVDVIGRLKPETSREAAAAELNVWAARIGTRSGTRTLPIRLSPSQGTLDADAGQALLAFSPVFFAFGLILMIGCANVANLQLARGVWRQRELAIRMSLGGSRRRLVRQLLTENLVLSLAAAAFGLALSRLCLEGLLYAAAAMMPPEIVEFFNLAAPGPDWRVLLFLIAGAVVATVLFGFLPAAQATRLELVRTMRGEVMRDARPGRARHALIALEVGSSALLLICAGIFLRSAIATAGVNPGVRTSDTVMLSVLNQSKRAPLLQALASHPSVAAIAASSRPRRSVLTIAGSTPTTASNTVEPSRQFAVDQISASPEYFSLLDIDIVQGRGFTAAERSEEESVAVVTETVARSLRPASAVGQVIQLQPSPDAPNAPPRPSRTLTVVGVVRDVTGPLAPDFFPPWAVYVPSAPERPGTNFTVRVHGDPEQARQALVERLTMVDPTLGEVVTLRTIAGLQTSIMRGAFGVAIALGVLALLLTLSGLFSVLSYIVEQRTKDIGVRIALGATARNVAELVLVESLRPVVTGLVAGGGLAIALATLLLATPAAGEIGGIVRLLDPVPYTASGIVVVTACLFATLVPTWRAMRIDPIATLRKE